jgi:hypothetical protein
MDQYLARRTEGLVVKLCIVFSPPLNTDQDVGLVISGDCLWRSEENLENILCCMYTLGWRKCAITWR